MNALAYHDLSALGYKDPELKAIAASVQVPDDPNDQGDIVDRPGRPSDHFKPPPIRTSKAARSLNHGALPPDLSLIVKGRKYGPDYIYAILDRVQKRRRPT